MASQRREQEALFMAAISLAVGCKRRKGKNEKGKGGWPAMVGGHRRRPEMAGDGRKWPEKVAKAPKEKVV